MAPALRHGPKAALVLLGIAGALVWLKYPTWPGYDSQYALLWGDELLHGSSPGFDDYRTPTQHPLLLPVGMLLSPLGHEAAARVFVALCIASLVVLAAAMYRLGVAAAGVLGGVLAAALLLSRLNFGLLAAIGFLDIPYCALLAWAAVLEVERPRRGGAVWLLLALAGLLRPEAWVLAGAYAVWLGWRAPNRRRVRYGALAAIAPLTWSALDLLVTGDPLFSLHHTDTLATELRREKPIGELPWQLVNLLEEVVKAPVLAVAAAGAALAAATRPRALLAPAALAILTCATWLLIAIGGQASVYRYLLPAGLGLIVFAAYALAGWTTTTDTRHRTLWAIAAAAVLLAGGAYTATRLNPDGVIAQLRERERTRKNLRTVLTAPAVTRARRCGPLTLPNHKLIPEVRAILDLPSDGVQARSDRSHPPQRTGVAIVVERRYERRPALNVWEVASDGLRSVMAPTGFRPLQGTRRFAALGRCE